MSILLDLMCASTVFEHSLSVMLRVGLYLQAVRVTRISVKVVVMAALFFGGHSTNKDGVEVINVCIKDVLHGFEGEDREHTHKVGVYCACVEVGKGI
jgi:hypothetical protein